jgi:hypothetical protein
MVFNSTLLIFPESRAGVSYLLLGSTRSWLFSAKLRGNGIALNNAQLRDSYPISSLKIG